MNNQFTLIDLIKLVVKKIRFIALVTLGAGLLAAGIALLKPNYYQASTTFYAASQDLLNPDKVFGKSTTEMYYFGNAFDIDRILSIGNGNDFVEVIIREFDLYDHYGIDTSKAGSKAQIRKRFREHYSIRKTKFDAVEITFEDTSPEVAAQVANRSRQVIDSLGVFLVKNRQHSMMNSYEASIQEREALLHNLRDSLITLRKKFNIYNSEVQGEILSTNLLSTESNLSRDRAMLESLEGSRNVSRDTIAFVRARVRGMEKQLEMLLDDAPDNRLSISKFNSGKNLIQTLETQYNQSANQLSWDMVRLGQLESIYNSLSSTIHVLETAEVPRIKSGPYRSFIVLGAMLIAFLATVMGVLLYEVYESVKDKL